MTTDNNFTLQANGTITGPLGNEEHLTGKEFALLLALYGRKGGILTKQAALTELYCGMDEPEIKIIEVFVCKLRIKMRRLTPDGTDHSTPRAIETDWGRGYHWNTAFSLDIPGASFLSVAVSEDLATRIEDLALALDCKVGDVIGKLVSNNIGKMEEETWE